VQGVNQLLPLVVTRNNLQQKAAFVEWIAQVATRRDLHAALGFGKHSEEKIVNFTQCLHLFSFVRPPAEGQPRLSSPSQKRWAGVPW